MHVWVGALRCGVSTPMRFSHRTALITGLAAVSIGFRVVGTPFGVHGHLHMSKTIVLTDSHGF
jgi:hypothetical protein